MSTRVAFLEIQKMQVFLIIHKVSQRLHLVSNGDKSLSSVMGGQLDSPLTGIDSIWMGYSQMNRITQK